MFTFLQRVSPHRIWASALMICSIAAAQQPWDGPRDGPPGQAHKRITFISYDFRNGGITGAYRGLYTAARELGWQMQLVDGGSDLATIRSAFSKAIDEKHDGIIIGGFEIEALAGAAEQAQQAGVVLVGWHAAAKPGPSKTLFTNVTSATDQVARLATDFLIANAQGRVGVVIFSDNRFAMPNAKTARMAEHIRACARCRLLAVENIRFEQARAAVPPAIARLNRRYGPTWTHNLAVNDVYFDAMNLALVQNHRSDIRNISAGDGSAVAISRIGSGMSQQLATVAEPTGLQGWQLADELNRAFAGQAPSGYVSRAILVTAPLLAKVNGSNIEADMPYRQAYRAIWQVGPDASATPPR